VCVCLCVCSAFNARLNYHEFAEARDAVEVQMAVRPGEGGSIQVVCVCVCV